MNETDNEITSETDSETILEAVNADFPSVGEVCDLPPRRAHLNWCKGRALDELERGGPILGTALAWASFVSDMQKSPETARHPALWTLGVRLYDAGHLNTPDAMTRHILGYN